MITSKVTPTDAIEAAHKGDHAKADALYQSAAAAGNRSMNNRRREWCGKIAGMVARNDFAGARHAVRDAINCGINLPQSYRAI